jgi:hypothetical protein
MNLDAKSIVSENFEPTFLIQRFLYLLHFLLTKGREGNNKKKCFLLHFLLTKGREGNNKKNVLQFYWSNKSRFGIQLCSEI